MKLLYREEKHVDETFSDYLSRLSYWNGFSSKKKFTNILSNLFDEKYENNTKKRKNEQKIHLMLEQLLKRNIPSPDTCHLAPYKIPNGRAKICTICWENQHYIRFFWHFNNYSACHIHNIEMQTAAHLTYNQNITKPRKTEENQNIKYNYPNHLLVELIKKHSKYHHGINFIEEQIEHYSYINSLVTFLDKYFCENRKTHLETKKTLELVESVNFLTMSAEEKIEKTLKTLLIGNELHEREARIIAAIRTSKKHYRFGYVYHESTPRNFQQWAYNEILSKDELLYVYLGLNHIKMEQVENTTFCDLFDIENLPLKIDRQLCMDIHNNTIRWPYKADEDLANYISSLKNSKPTKKLITYNEYLHSNGKKTITNLPLKTNNSFSPMESETICC